MRNIFVNQSVAPLVPDDYFGTGARKRKKFRVIFTKALKCHNNISLKILVVYAMQEKRLTQNKVKGHQNESLTLKYKYK